MAGSLRVDRHSSKGTIDDYRWLGAVAGIGFSMLGIILSADLGSNVLWIHPLAMSLLFLVSWTLTEGHRSPDGGIQYQARIQFVASYWASVVIGSVIAAAFLFCSHI